MIIMIACNDIENHTPIKLCHICLWHIHSSEYREYLLVRVPCTSVKMSQSSQCLHVNFFAIVESVESFGHKMVTVSFGQ